MRTPTPKSRPEPALASARALAFGAALLGAAGCQGITANSPEAAQVRFVHASAETPALDMYLDNEGAAYNLNFGTVTSYISLAPGDYRLSAHRGGTAQALVSGQTVLSASSQYTAVISNTLGNLQETVFPDENAPAPPGTLAVRVIDEAVLSGPLDVYLVPSGETLTATDLVAHELGLGAVAGYEHLPAGKAYTVFLVPSGSVPRKVASPSHTTVTGASGAVRTILLSDTAVKPSKGVTTLVLNDYDAP